MSKQFFAALEPLNDHALMVEDQYYRDLPSDWSVVLTDVRNSTQAIEAGRYKEVNMVGVSCIISVQNALGDLEFPFVFGGDGATLAVPTSELPLVKAALGHSRAVAHEAFGLELRIAIIPAAELVKQGESLQVAKLRISQGHYLALVRGRGWTLAETWMKERSEFNLPIDHTASGDMEGLECRWNPVPARKDEILALIVQSRESGAAAAKIYREILNELLDPDMRPVKLSNLPLTWPPKYLVQEAKLRLHGFTARARFLLKTYALTLLYSVVLGLRGRKKNEDTPIPYVRELTENTDYLKFDECLRMIIDVSTAQKERLLAKLEAHRVRGEIFYGYHADRHALMTCYIQGPQKHMHFVDAGGGGYAMAAKLLKAQKRTSNPAAISVG